MFLFQLNIFQQVVLLFSICIVTGSFSVIESERVNTLLYSH